MRVTKEQVAAHRAAIVQAAADLVRARGIEKASVAEIMRAAGLTHGGFYGHFGSKEALLAEACGLAMEKTLPKADLGGFLDGYLGSAHRDAPASGCPMAALASEIPRQEAPVRERFTAGIAAHVEALAGMIDEERGPDDTRRRAITLLAMLVGGVALARACATSDPALSRELLTVLRTAARDLAGA